MEIKRIVIETEELSYEMLEFIKEIEGKHPFTKCSYDDLVHTFYLWKISELQNQINELKK